MLSVAERGNPKAGISFNSGRLQSHFPKILSNFVDKNNSPNSSDELERTWFFEKSPKSTELNIIGRVGYGTYGFESNFKNNTTKKVNYHRKTDDVEEIPLYFHFWTPGKNSFSFVVFQSFQGRSCVQLVLEKLKEEFELRHPDLILKIRKMVPTDLSGSVYNTAPVKGIRLIKRNTPSDIADAYHAGRAPVGVDVELIVKARRSKSIGTFEEVARSLKSDGVILYKGLEFEEAVATIKVGGKLRPVGIFGDNSKAGVIDVSDSVEIGPDGHPTLISIQLESNKILQDFYISVTGR